MIATRQATSTAHLAWYRMPRKISDLRETLLALGLIAQTCVAAPSHNSGDAEPSIELFDVVRNGTSVGTVEVHSRGDYASVRYKVNDFGRGENLLEEIVFDAHHVPLNWSVSGSNEHGAPVEEHFARADGAASWTSDVDHGKLPDDAATLYIANDRTPYAPALILHALREAPKHQRSIWPSGRLRATQLPERLLRLGRRDLRVIPWAIFGLDFAPVLVLEDEGHQTLAVCYEDQLLLTRALSSVNAAFRNLADEIDTELLERASRRLLHHWNSPIYLRNVRVFNPDERLLSEARTLVIYGDRISGVRAGTWPTPAEAVSIDGQGGTVLPGLCDVHTHLQGWHGPLHLARGVTTARDMGNDNAKLAELVRKIDQGAIAGPRTVLSGLIEGDSSSSGHDGIIVRNEAEALDAVHWYADRGYWQIKIYSALPPPLVAPIAREAHALGLRVAGHVPSFMSSEQAIRDGYDEITHINQLLLSLVIDVPHDDTRTLFRISAFGERAGGINLNGEGFQSLMHLMKQRDIALDPTLAIFTQLLLSRPGVLTPATEPWVGHMPAPVQREWLSGMMDVHPDQDVAYRASARNMLEAVKMLFEDGIRIFPGTDTTAGFMLDSELELWVRAGIPAAEVLHRATSACADYLGLGHELGRIEAGKHADLLLVPGDPLTDIGSLRRVNLVMKNGTVLLPAEIDAMYGIEPFSSPPPIGGAMGGSTTE